MRASFLIGSIAFATAAVMACAATGENDGTQLPEQDSGTSVPPVTDSGTTEVDAGGEASVVEPPRCSPAGWCLTDLPDSDLLMKDLWPLAGRAFAVAESPTLGVKVLEWVDSDAKWTYIDDGSQNEDGRGRWAGRIWAPSENEVYFGVSPNYVFRGTRTAPGLPWSWAHDSIGTSGSVDPDDGNPSYWKRPGSARTPALGIWGTSSADVYAWFKGTIYQRSSVDGGAPEWVPVYVAADTDVPAEQMYFFAAAGKSADDVWFAGGRSRSLSGCALLVRRTSTGWERTADGVAGSFNQACKPRAGRLLVGGAEGWLTDIEVLSPDEIVALKGARDVVKISVDSDSYSVAPASIPTTLSANGLNSLSSTEGDLWLGGTGLIVRGAGVWDGGAFEISSSSLNGAPLTWPIYRVRGTSNSNLWAIGVRYALHKTTP